VSAADEAAPVSAAEAKTLFTPFADVPTLILAVSGGPDSTALLMLAARWRKARKYGPRLLAVTVDHGLRRESADEARAVKRLARRLGVPHRTVRWRGKKAQRVSQQAARQARYRLLGGAARAAKARHVLTAHTLDDQAETVLMRMSRGSGVSGLGAMARASPLPLSGEQAIELVRPLLDVPKARLIATLQHAGIAFVDDASNRDPRFTRTRLREAMPALARAGLDAPALALVARRLRRAYRKRRGANAARSCSRRKSSAGLRTRLRCAFSAARSPASATRARSNSANWRRSTPPCAAKKPPPAVTSFACGEPWRERW